MIDALFWAFFVYRDGLLAWRDEFTRRISEHSRHAHRNWEKATLPCFV